MNEHVETELEQLNRLQAEFDADSALLTEVWEALAARGQDAVPVTDAELAAIGESCSFTPTPKPSNPTFGLRC
ncbi:MAG TPA: hypothetical protein PKA88_05930 [Polyangiaceae bacterium]|nr:hypothetical protein [Polyangiaceae bacterium]HMR75398.1 hypothetical protein [Polyangiaceae bacterium]